MTQEEALEKLELEVGASQQEIQQQYQEFYNEFQMRITNAPTTHQKTLYQKKLKQLEEAYTLLTGKNTEIIDDDLPWSSPGQTEYQEQYQRPEEPSKSNMTKAFALKLLGLKEPFSYLDLKSAYDIRKNSFQKSFDDAPSETIRKVVKSEADLLKLAANFLKPFVVNNNNSQEFTAKGKTFLNNKKGHWQKIEKKIDRFFNIFKFSYLLFICLLLLFLFDAFDTDIISIIAILIILASFLVFYGFLGLLYNAWKIVQDDKSTTTPTKAILYLFIPFFNMYWVFISYRGLFKEFNRIYNLKIDLTLVTVFCIICVIPYLNYMAFIISPILLHKIYKLSKSTLAINIK